MKFADVLSILIRIVEVAAIILMYIAAVNSCKKAKELEKYVNDLERERTDKEVSDARKDYKMIADLNAVSKYLIDNLPRVSVTYRVPMNLKKYLVVLL